MTEEESKIRDCEIMVSSSHSATELVELAARLRQHGVYYEIPKWQEFYNVVCSQIARRSGIQDSYWIGTSLDTPLDNLIKQEMDALVP